MNKNLTEYLKQKAYTIPFSEKDLIEAYNLGRIELLKELEQSLRGYVVNGIIKGVILEEEIYERIKEIEKQNP